MLRDCPGAVTCQPAPVRHFTSRPLARYIDKSARNDPLMLRAIAEEWETLMNGMNNIAEFCDSLTLDEFIPLMQSVMRLSCYGVKFARPWLDWLDEMRASIINTGEDGDSDGSDEYIEQEDSHDDRGTCPFGRDAAGWCGVATSPLTGLATKVNDVPYHLSQLGMADASAFIRGVRHARRRFAKARPA